MVSDAAVRADFSMCSRLMHVQGGIAGELGRSLVPDGCDLSRHGTRGQIAGLIKLPESRYAAAIRELVAKLAG